MIETLKDAEKTKARKVHRCDYCCGLIEKQEVYQKSSHKYDGMIYTWKSHLNCVEIASKLNMHENARDNGYEGCSNEFFDETIRCKYRDLMIEKGNFETKEHKYPVFKERLDYVLIHYKIK